MSKDWLNKIYTPNSKQWIRCKGPIARPARSTNINPMDFFVQGFLKKKKSM